MHPLPPGAARLIALAALLLSFAVQSFAAPPVAPKPRHELSEKQAARLREAVAANPAAAAALFSEYLNRLPGAACHIASLIAQALPKKDGAPDLQALVAFARTAVEIIYAEQPTARREVKCLVATIAESLGLNGAAPNPRSLVLLLESVLPAILANDPALAGALFQFFADSYPNAAALLGQLRARTLSPFGTLSLLPRPGEPPAVEPNSASAPPLKPLPDEAPPATPIVPSTP